MVRERRLGGQSIGICVCVCVCVCWGSAGEPSLKFPEESIIENYHSEVV